MENLNSARSKEEDKRFASGRQEGSEAGRASADKKANTGDWDDQRDEARTDEEGDDGRENDNTGGAGSTGSAATNS
ncbi:MAG TPA: hypothetical protein VFR70_03880 [Flavobacterium sp.]|nr:hypothetical protein [Flavobacterium sp.]